MVGNLTESGDGRILLEDLKLGDRWPSVGDIDLADAIERAVTSLRQADLCAYYAVESDFAGASFAHLGDNDPMDITADDLHAVSMLSVMIGPRATRRLLDVGPERGAVIEALSEVSLDKRIEQANAGDFEKMWAFHAAVKKAVSQNDNSNPWVTAAKLTARKRPHLIPVRDNVVAGVLGHDSVKSASVYWQMMRGLMRNDSVRRELRQARDRVTADGLAVRVDDSDLRFLDAALWMHSIHPVQSDAGGEVQ